MISPWTGDHVGRSERHCLDCPKRQISSSTFTKEHQKELGDKRWITYIVGDKIDKLTKEWLRPKNYGRTPTS